MSLNHKHLIVRSVVKKPPTDPELVNDWLRRVVEAAGMKIVIGPHSHYCTGEGNEGIAGLVGIATSHASVHVWDKAEVPYLNFDLYSCSDFDPKVILDLLQEFEPEKTQYMVLDRNSGIGISEFGSIPKSLTELMITIGAYAVLSVVLARIAWYIF